MYRLLISLLCAASLFTLYAQDLATSSDPELDRIRAELREIPTNRDNFKLRALKMKLWVVTLQQQGARLHDYIRIDDGMRSEIWWNNTEGPGMDGTPQTFTDQQMEKLCRLVDEGYAILDSVQHALVNAEPLPENEGQPLPDPGQGSLEETPWMHYKGNENLSGYTGAAGPVKGEKAWTFPVGLAWESKPAIEGDRVYLSSPGMRTILNCLDLETGKEIWKSRQVVEIMGIHFRSAYDRQGQDLHRPAGRRRRILLPGCCYRGRDLEPENRLGLGLGQRVGRNGLCARD